MAERYRQPYRELRHGGHRAICADGVEVLYTAHAVKDELGPIFHFEFEHATVTYSGRDSEIMAQFHDGRVAAAAAKPTPAASSSTIVSTPSVRGRVLCAASRRRWRRRCA
ncbi:MAG: hypothetical protein R2856_09795 [Caldilineaceae bacterium]